MQALIPLYEIPERKGLDQPEELRLYQLKNSLCLAGNLSSIPLKTDIPHRHSFYEIFFFLSGYGEHMIDFQAYEVQTPSLHFIRPGQVHLLSNTKIDQGYVLAFSRELWASENIERATSLMWFPFGISINSKPILSLSSEDVDYFKTLLSQILIEYKQKRKNAHEIVKSYLKVWLMYCEGLFENYIGAKVQEESRANVLVAKYQALIEENFVIHQQVQDYARQLNISPDHLNKLCKLVLGQKAGELLLGRIILEAKRLLLYSGKSQKEIAYELQFKDASYFGRIFRRKTSLTPLGFRKQMQEKYHT